MANPTGKGLKPNKRRVRNGGRQLGTPTQTPSIVKDALLMAAEIAGNILAARKSTKKRPNQVAHLNGMVAYLTQQAIDCPRSFMPVLGRVMPLQIYLRQEKPGAIKYKTFAEVTAALKARGYTDKSIAAIIEAKTGRPMPKIIEHREDE
jgi:hypothetical protein